jgi:hypothetical protein
VPTPPDWPLYLGHASAVAARGAVGVMLDHRDGVVHQRRVRQARLVVIQVPHGQHGFDHLGHNDARGRSRA